MKKILTLFFIFFLCTSWSFAQIFTTPTMVGDDCVDEMIIKVEAWGAGGGSIVGNQNPTRRRDGGGGGAYFTSTYTVTPGQTVTGTIGLGVAGANGGNTSFSVAGGASVTVNGGGVASGSTAGAGGVAPAGGVDGAVGGERGGSNNGTGGGGGGSGPAPTPGGNGGTGGGAGGTSDGTTIVGGAGGPNGGDGLTGMTPGGGGGGGGTGGTSSAADGDSAGGDGDVIVTVISFTTKDCPLPVELVRFNANAKDNRILLDWQTASERNNDGFIIEKGDKTAYGMEWNRFGFIQGNGTTQEAQTYSFIDQRPEEGFNYYRLKQMDFDGAYEYSSIIAVDYDKEAGSAPIAIFPNPAKGELIVENGVGQATIFNVLGKPVKQLTIANNQATIELSELINGQYYLQVLQADGTTVMKQFVKMD